LMGTSGDDAMADAALAAGADGFLPKPIASITAFQAAILSHLPPEERPSGPRAILEDEIAPDTIAYHDDLAHALDALKEGEVAYVGQFLEGVARHAGDDVLVEQAQQLGLAPENDDLVLETRGVIKARMGPRMAV
ncbi:MAG: response regulator, partial [Pseudomonadota bacterium]